MAMKVENNKLSDAVELITKYGFQGMPEAMQIILNEAMLIGVAGAFMWDFTV